MKKPITTALLILASGLTLSTTALAEPFTHGSGYVDAISNTDSNANIQRVPSVQHSAMIATTSRFNDRGTVENEEVAVGSGTVVETSMSRMLSAIASGFNDRG